MNFEVGAFVGLFQLQVQTTLQIDDSGVVTGHTFSNLAPRFELTDISAQGLVELGYLLAQNESYLATSRRIVERGSRVCFFPTGICLARISKVNILGFLRETLYFLTIEVQGLVVQLVVTLDSNGTIQSIQMTDQNGEVAIAVELLWHGAKLPG